MTLFDPVGKAEITFLVRPENPIGWGGMQVVAVRIDYSGRDTLRQHLPGACLDWALVYNRRRWRKHRHDIVNGVVGFLATDEKPGARWSEVPVVQEFPPFGFADQLHSVTISVRADDRRQVIRANVTTVVNKPLLSDSDFCHGLCASLWDWASATLDTPTVIAMGKQLNAQCDRYRRVGLPGRRHLGRAPYEAIFAAR